MAPPTGRREGDGGRDGGEVHWFRAVVVLAVVVLVGVGVLAKVNTGHGTPKASSGSTSVSSTTVAAPTTTTTTVPPSQVKVQVLNGVLTGPLAGEWSQKLKSSYGYITEPPDNATAKVSASAIYVLTPGYSAEANALAQQVGLSASAVNPTVPAPASAPIPASERATANLVLVIGPDLASSA